MSGAGWAFFVIGGVWAATVSASKRRGGTAVGDALEVSHLWAGRVGAAVESAGVGVSA